MFQTTNQLRFPWDFRSRTTLQFPSSRQLLDDLLQQHKLTGLFQLLATKQKIAISGTDLELPTIYIYKACKIYVTEYSHKIWPYVVQYLHFSESPTEQWGIYPKTLAMKL